MNDVALVVIDGIEMDEFDAKAAGKCIANLKGLERGESENKFQRQLQ